MLSAYFYKNEMMFQIDLKCDLKEEADLKSRCCFTLLWTDNAKILNTSEPECGNALICVKHNMPK